MTEQHSVLVVDDDSAVGASLFRLLKQAGYKVRHEASGEAGLAAFAADHFDLVITDLRMPGMDGMEVLSALHQEDPSLPVVMLTAHGTVAVAVEAMRRGARDFLEKPPERATVLHVVDTALSAAKVGQDVVPEAAPGEGDLIGSSETMASCLSLVDRAARAPAPVLILGESGTGKELVARAIHDRSARSAGPFMPINCAALPGNLIEAELFGYVKGAFTGAVADHPGRVEIAAGGTLFLDELGDIPLSTQVKLLRLLNEREYTPVGATETREADVRFVSATHRDLDAMVADGTFREDLYFRVNVLPIVLPPLRDRGGDILEIADHYLAQVSGEYGRPGMSFDDGARSALAGHAFPGNVRELLNLVRRVVIFADSDTVSAADVTAQLHGPGQAVAGADSVEEGTLLQQQNAVRKNAAIRALARAGGNRTQAAKLLGVARRTMHNLIDEFDLD